MLPNDAVNITPLGDELNGEQPAESWSITVNGKVVNINTLAGDKKAKLIDFLSFRYNENVKKIERISLPQDNFLSTDFDQLIHLLTVELNASNMSDKGQAKLVYLLHNRVNQQDKIISGVTIKAQSSIIFDDPSVNSPAKLPEKTSKQRINASPSLFSGRQPESVLVEDVVNGGNNKKTLAKPLTRELDSLSLEPKVSQIDFSLGTKKDASRSALSVGNTTDKTKAHSISTSKLKAAFKPSADTASQTKTRDNLSSGPAQDLFSSSNAPSLAERHERAKFEYESDDEDDEVEVGNESLFELKDHYKSHAQKQWPTSHDKMAIEVLHLSDGQVKDVNYLQKGESFSIILSGKKCTLAKNTRKGECVFYYIDEHFNGEVRQRDTAKLKVVRLTDEQSKGAQPIPNNSDVCLRSGPDTFVLRTNLAIQSPSVEVTNTDFKTAFRSLATSTGFHLFMMLLLALILAFSGEDKKPKDPIFVKMELPKEKLIEKKVQTPKPKPKEVIKPKPKPKPKAVAKPKAKQKVKAPKKVKAKKKAVTKTAKKPVKKPLAKQKAGAGDQGNIKKRQVKNSGLLSMLGSSNKPAKSSMAKITSLDAVASSNRSAPLKVSGLKANLKGSRMSLPSGELITSSGAANALRSGGVGGKGSVAALSRGGTGKQAVSAMVSANMSRNVKIKGGLTREQVKSVIDAHMDDITYCYETALMSSPSLGGKIVFEWKVKNSGKVGGVNIKSSSVKSDGIHSCIKSAIKSWPFPQPSGGSSVVVSYPFIFDTVGF